MLRRFLKAAGCRPTWTMRGVIDEQTERIAAQVGDGRAICGLSGGVDSAVAAALVQRAIGSRLSCVFVDHGLLRTGEAEQVEQDFVAATGVDLTVVDAAEEFLAALAGVTDPEQKRKIIGREFIRAFEQAARKITGAPGGHGEQVTIPGPGHAVPGRGRVRRRRGAANIKSHHNVGGLPDDLGVRAGRAAADAVQGRGARGRPPTRPAAGDRLAAAVPRAGPRDPDRRRGHQRAAADRAGRGRDRPRRALRGRPGPRDLAVPGGAAGRRPLGRAFRATAAATVTRSCSGR